MLRRVSALTIAAALSWPAIAVAQDQAEAAEGEESPPMLMISSWQCDFGAIGDIDEDWENRGMTAAQAALDSGAWASGGVFYHAWADEWNVNFWATGEDVASLIEGNSTRNSTYGEMYPDDGLNPWDHCSAHKDGFYQFGPATDGGDDEAEDDEADDAESMLAISSWQCTDVPAVADAWENVFLAKAQAVVDAGEWESAGVYYHAWADEWNVNFYYIAEDIPQILEGWQMYIGSITDEDPDITEYCSKHKDGLYQFGETLEADDEEEDETGAS